MAYARVQWAAPRYIVYFIRLVFSIILAVLCCATAAFVAVAVIKWLAVHYSRNMCSYRAMKGI